MIPVDRHTHTVLRETLAAINGLSVYTGIRSESTVSALRMLLQRILKHTSQETDSLFDLSTGGKDSAKLEGQDLINVLQWVEDYTSLYSLLLPDALSATPDLGDGILNAVRFDDNPFVRNASGIITDAGCGVPEAELKRLMLGEFERIRKIASFPARMITGIVSPYIATELPEWRNLPPETDSLRLYEDFFAFHREHSFGIFSKYHAFIWKNGELEPVAKPDPISLEQLFSYDYEINQVKENTFRLLERRRADNILLFGARGTGKSSTVKAIANAYKGQGLRLIEIDKDSFLTIADLLAYLSELTSVRLSFILFLDDLTFPEDDHRYTVLKTLLEGGMKTRPENVAIYATSNRRHIVAEKESNDMYANDAKEERLSLSDRFGISVRFSSPTQKIFLDIVYGILENRGITYDPEITAQRAITWTMRENGRSPRTARQFADYYESELRASRIAENTPSSST